VLLDVTLGHGERTDEWLDLSRGLNARDLRSPLLVVSAEAPGLTRAITELWPDAERSRSRGCHSWIGHRGWSPSLAVVINS
jgi:transposase-like protein